MANAPKRESRANRPRTRRDARQNTVQQAIRALEIRQLRADSDPITATHNMVLTMLSVITRWRGGDGLDRA